MDYCHYHPLAPANFFCEHCNTYNCDTCVDESHQRGGERCFTCGGQVTLLGGANSAEPFWRRLPQAFRYPLNAQSLTLIVGVSLLTSILAYIPFALVVYLVATGALLRYSFSCLENTASGKTRAPDISEAYDGGLVLLFQLIGIVAVMVAAVIGVDHLLGAGLAKLLGVLLALGFPAIIILFALDQSLLSALNPLKIFQLILAVGMSYGVLLGLIMVMTASVEVIHALIGADFSFINSFLQSIVSNYYTVVAFHIMGYMIFQYQATLGFVAREDDGEYKESRTEQARHNVKIDIALKRGEYGKVVDLFAEANSKFPAEHSFYLRCFDYLCTVRILDRLSRFLPFYLTYLSRSKRSDLIYNSYKRALTLVPTYEPDTAMLRHFIAEQCTLKGDPRTALKLLNGLHKQFPNYPRLVTAYEVMLSALEALPGLEKQRLQCEKFVAALKAKAPAPAIKNQRLEPKNTDATADQAVAGELPPIEFKL